VIGQNIFLKVPNSKYKINRGVNTNEMKKKIVMR